MTNTVMENEVIVKGKRSKIASFEMNIKSTAEKNAASNKYRTATYNRSATNHC